MVLPIGLMLMELTIMVLGFLAYQQFFDQANLASPNATAASYMAAMERESALHVAEHVAQGFELYKNYGNWIWAQYMNSEEESKKMWRADKDFLMMFNLMPEDVKEWTHEDGTMGGGKKDDDKEDDMDMEKDDDMLAYMPSLRIAYKI